MPDILWDIHGLSHQYHVSKKLIIPALQDISFQIYRGEILGLVGESGCGKSTLAQLLMNTLTPSAGHAYYHGIDIFDPAARRQNRALLHTKRQMIFQSAAASLDPFLTVADIIAEPLEIHHITTPRGSARAEAAFQLPYVGLDPSYLDSRPTELSGGQRQRVAIARALACEPEFLIADEPVAALDVSIQAQILRLFRHLQAEHGFTFLFIAHDLSMVRYLCNRVGVMCQGRLIELAPTEELFTNPLHPYTKSLLSAIPLPDPRRERARRFQPWEGVLGNGTLCPVSADHLVWKEVAQDA